MIDFKCPHCRNHLRVKDSAAGMKGKCKVCGKSITVPVEPQVEEWDDSVSQEDVEEAIEDFLPPPKPRKIDSGKSKTKSKRTNQNGSGNGLLKIGVAVGVMCLLGIGVFVVALISSRKLPNVGGGKQDVAELAKAKADAEAAKTELAKVQAKAQEKERKCVVSGELFVTTQSGDVKKAAGLSVRFLPVTAEFRNRLTELVKQFDDCSEERDAAMKAWNAKNPEPLDSFSSKHSKWLEAQSKHVYGPLSARFKVISEDGDKLLAKTSQETTTNSDGKFHIEVEAGPYALVSGMFSMPFDKLVWCKAIKAEGSNLALNLNQESAVEGHKIGDKAFEPSAIYIMKDILNQIGQ